MKSVIIVAIAKGCDLADGLLNGGEAGLLHLRTISKLIGKEIRVSDTTGKILGIFGEHNDCSKFKSILEPQVSDKRMLTSESTNESSFVEINKDKYNLKEKQSLDKENLNWFARNPLSKSYLELQYQYLHEGKIRHWTSNKDEKTEEVRCSFNNENNCLFDAICQQCRGFEPKSLRVMTADALKKKILIVEDGFPQFKGAGILLLGGAQYNGNNADDAGVILDNSQGTSGHGHYAKAHPRGHASHPGATGNIDSVENYSRSASQDFPKSAWMSRAEQNESINRLLHSRDAQNGMERLNRGETRVVIKMHPGFDIQVGLWAEGVMFRGPIRADMVTIILQHHAGRFDESNADVQVFTCYPMAPRGNDNINAALMREIYLKRSHPVSDDDDNEEIKKAKT